MLTFHRNNQSNLGGIILNRQFVKLAKCTVYLFYLLNRLPRQKKWLVK